MADHQKRAAGEAAAELIQDGTVVGLGTGSTAVHFVQALARRRLDLTCVATSRATAELATRLGLRLAALDDVGRIDVTVDGADEIGPELALIKGGGGALLREKLVWQASARCIVIADAGKRVGCLGRFPLPIEVTPFGHRHTAARIAGVLEAAHLPTALRLRGDANKPFVTDNGNLIYDAALERIAAPAPLARALKAEAGVVEHGLFIGLAATALISTEAGIERL
ncbi:ribose 5-phosphate isomerase A [Pseudoroseomonas deserti]|uniref:Ribose-5-phosphate isomerase A n=1 Tax=Teichococcus deserti TaxID=1817963 RepID=A0A1V2H8P1_9PROT|nr:ribose-5-phosphate isomerase RpiA [Pseudoroseomonas deserti]ONG58853.1 ribose 5-phosphate isomerase A [Pseudoroseomonas deserti]